MNVINRRNAIFSAPRATGNAERIAARTERKPTMSRKLCFVVAAGVTLIAFLLLRVPTATAQDVTPDDANCLACHENLYYLYDTGKWHCLCEATPSCLHCHGGQPGTLDEDQAHAGMLANPLQENAAVCQRCHGDDSEERVDEFIAVAGGTVTGGRGRTFPTPGPEPTSPPPGGSTYHLAERLREPWRLAALGLTAGALAGLGLVGLACHLAERHRPLAR
jgi:hypothetical protein